MSTLLFDLPDNRLKLLPFTYTRPICDIRVGILTIREKWEAYFKQKINHITASFLSDESKSYQCEIGDLLIFGGACPNLLFYQEVTSLQNGQVLQKEGVVLAAKLAVKWDHSIVELNQIIQGYEIINSQDDFTLITSATDIFLQNGEQIRADFSLITKDRVSQEIDDAHTIVYGKENVFLEEGATIRASIINASDGPVYLGKNSIVHEGCLIKGPFVLGEESHLNMGAKMKGDNTIGPFCKVGGEVSNSVFFGYSNKGHDGFLGNSVIGEWCNLGADTNSSNLKNNYSTVKVWDYPSQGFKTTALQFCGLLMGDHSKCGINTMFNTGTVVGVSANVFGAGFPPKFIPSFTWGGADGFTTFEKEKAFEVANAVMKRRKISFTAHDQSVLTAIYEQSELYRNKELKK